MFKFIRFLFVLGICLVIMAASLIYGFSSLFEPANIDDPLVQDAASQFYDSNGAHIYTTLSEERRLPVALDRIPRHVQLAFIAIEDNRFYEHIGIDFRGTTRALISNLRGEEVQGGSTITQQLAKNAFLTQERTLERKIREAFIAIELERKYTKDEILEMYLNEIYFGRGSYGVESAALYYFGVHASDLTLAQAATLAAIPKSPNYYNPFENPEESKERQELVLDQMAKYGFIESEEAEAAKAEVLTYNTKRDQRDVDLRSYFYDMISQNVIELVGADALYKGGLKVYTTLDPEMQAAAEAAMKHLPDYYKDENGLTQPQVALVAVDTHTGYIKAMLGGRGEDKFNRASLAVRQPGSSFKPFVYLTAMQNGYTPASVVVDEEEEFSPDWKPLNSDKKWHGKVSLRTALSTSLNVPTIKLAKIVGVDKIVANVENMGISTLVNFGTYNDSNLAMAIGGLTRGVNLLEMASAYSVFSTNGIYVKPTALLKIVDRNGKVLYEAEPKPKRVVDAEAAYLTTNMLEDVLVSGTAGGMGIGRPAAGKTGTTDDYNDAWFIGFTPDLCAAVWVGDDNNKPMQRMYGSGTPLSIWHDFMVAAVEKMPPTKFENPGIKIPPEPLIRPEERKVTDAKVTDGKAADTKATDAKEKTVKAKRGNAIISTQPIDAQGRVLAKPDTGSTWPQSSANTANAAESSSASQYEAAPSESSSQDATVQAADTTNSTVPWKRKQRRRKTRERVDSVLGNDTPVISNKPSSR